MIAAYTGTALSGLTQLAVNDQFNGSNQSQITFPVASGTTYRIAVDGFGSTTGNVGLQWSIDPPANDGFSSPKVLPGLSGRRSATNVRATGEPGELDYHGGAAADNSVWFTWTPTESAPSAVRLVNVAGGLSPGIGVYTGDSPGALTPVGGGPAEVLFNAVAGTTYRIAVDGNAGSTGPFDLKWVAMMRPAAPTVKNSTPLEGAVRVAFTPGSDGGSPITGFTAKCVSTNGGVTKTKTGPSSPITVINLTGDKNYHCRVRATNAVGTGPYGPFGSTVQVLPTPPDAPTVKNTTPLDDAVRVAFNPGYDGGSAITGYTAQCVSTDGGVTSTETGTSSPITVTDLTSSKSYHCRVRATNAVGISFYSDYGATVLVP